MKTLLLFSAIVVCFTILTGMEFYKDKYMSKDGVKIVVYKYGKKIPIDPETPHFKKLQEKCEEFFTSAVTMARCFISKEMVSDIKEKECAIEVVYNKPKEIEITYFKRKDKANCLLIPLEGKYVDTGENANVMMFFYDREFQTSPRTAPRDVAKIIDFLKLMGINID